MEVVCLFWVIRRAYILSTVTWTGAFFVEDTEARWPTIFKRGMMRNGTIKPLAGAMLLHSVTIVSTVPVFQQPVSLHLIFGWTNAVNQNPVVTCTEYSRYTRSLKKFNRDHEVKYTTTQRFLSLLTYWYVGQCCVANQHYFLICLGNTVQNRVIYQWNKPFCLNACCNYSDASYQINMWFIFFNVKLFTSYTCRSSLTSDASTTLLDDTLFPWRERDSDFTYL